MVALCRRGAKALAELVLPRSAVVWRGRDGRPGPGKVALTFDDGPTALTPAYLDVLDQLGVRATFFVVGEMCRARPDLLAEIQDRGHEVAGHGYTHRPFTELSEGQLRDELSETQALLPPQGHRPFVRPPFGAMSLRSMLTCAGAGYTTVLWSVDSGDWCNLEAGAVARSFTEQTISAGEIALLHDGQPWTIDALPTIVDSVRKAGHEPVTVGELLA
jgi:peptidoglycan/xylan/chitin deacetylase (PgdA/CDA1 family)